MDKKAARAAVANELMAFGAVNVLDTLIDVVQNDLKHEPSTGTEHARFLRHWLVVLNEMMKQVDSTGEKRRELARQVVARQAAEKAGNPQGTTHYMIFPRFGQKPKN
jgi:hypothetical protein